MNVSRFTVRTSDRRVFRRCLRKWGWQSSLKANLQRKGTEQNINFWFGSAIHFAMEDYFGWNRFGDPRRALKAYFEAFDPETLPAGASIHYDLGIGMLTYFLEWYPKHNTQFDFQTLWLNDDMQQVEPFSEGAHPAVEQQFFLDLGIQAIYDVKRDRIICQYTPDMQQYIKKEAGSFDFTSGTVTEETTWFYMEDTGWIQVEIVPVHYHGTVDRVVVDKYGRWWILDYKTAKGADTNKLDTDDQISAYLWAAEQWFKHPIYGFIYLQLTKEVAKPPKRLKDGTLSVDKKQKTTYHLVRQAIIDEYGSIQKAPMKYIDFLNIMAEKETPEGDRFIRWDFVQRSAAQKVATYNHIIGELTSMLNPKLYLYPNPTRDCIWDCPLRSACLAIDDAREDEVKYLLETEYEPRPRGEDGGGDAWRERIVYPDTPMSLGTLDEFAIDLDCEFNVQLPDEYIDDIDY